MAAKGNDIGAGLEPVDAIAGAGDVDASCDICSEPHYASPKGNQCSPATCGATGCRVEIGRAEGPAEDGVVRVCSHHCLWYVGLAIQGGTEIE